MLFIKAEWAGYRGDDWIGRTGYLLDPQEAVTEANITHLWHTTKMPTSDLALLLFPLCP